MCRSSLVIISILQHLSHKIAKKSSWSDGYIFFRWGEGKGVRTPDPFLGSAAAGHLHLLRVHVF